MDDIVDFYRGSGTDHRGRTIDQLWTFDQDELEGVHDFIQWLFPTDRPSAFNPWAPVLTAESILGLGALPDLHPRMERSLDLMLAFYGLQRHRDGPSPVIEPAPTLQARGPRWWGAGNHNHLRLTRIIASLGLLGLVDEAVALERALQGIRTEHQTGISAETARYWADAAANTRTEPLEGSPPR